MLRGIKNKTDLLLALLYAGKNLSPDQQSSEPVIGITRLEKLLFLLKKDEGFLETVPDPERNDFHFVPFRMGPWTHEVYDEVDFLESLGLLTKEGRGKRSVADAAHDDELFSEMALDKYQKTAANIEEEIEVFSLTEKGKKKAAGIWNRLIEGEKKSIINLKKKFNKMDLRQFLRYVYKKHPEYCAESEIKSYLNV